MLVAVATCAASGGSAAAAPPRAQVAGRSVEGRPILVYPVGDADARRDVLIVGCIHGDECAAFPVVARLIRGAPVPGVRLWIVPSVNPDGRRRGTRGNARGVDLNRNFPHRWRPIPFSSRYHSGPRPLSEPESRAVRDLILRIRPDLSIWYHQPERNVRDPDASPPARRYARMVGLPFLPLAAPPGTVAEWTEWRLAGAEAFVVELAAGSLGASAVARHLRAVRRVAAG
jgi:protein MpaA